MNCSIFKPGGTYPVSSSDRKKGKTVVLYLSSSFPEFADGILKDMDLFIVILIT